RCTFSMLSAAGRKMLIKSKVLEGIKAGEISLIFRRWKKRGVKAGGTQMTQRGVIGIDAVDVVAESSITAKDAKAAGFDSRAELIESMPPDRSEEHTSELQSRENLVCRLLLEKKKQ